MVLKIIGYMLMTAMVGTPILVFFGGIFFYIRGKVWPVAYCMMFYHAFMCVIVGLILVYALPPQAVVMGKNIPVLPFCTGAVSVILGLMGIPMSSKPKESSEKSCPILGWFMVGLGVTVLASGWVFACVALYSPQLMGSVTPLPGLAIYSLMGVSATMAAFFYLVSRISIPSRPNAIRGVIMHSAFVANFVYFLAVLILIYAVPGDPRATFPFQAGLGTGISIPFSMVIFLMAKDWVTKSATDNENNQPPPLEAAYDA